MKRKYTIGIACILTGIVAVICSNTVLEKRRTPLELMEEVRYVDSIMFVTERKDIPKDHISGMLRRDSKRHAIEKNAPYDKGMQAYKVTYYTLAGANDTVTEKQIRKNGDKFVSWVRVGFKSNNGDYMVNPEIIRTVRIARKNGK